MSDKTLTVRVRSLLMGSATPIELTINGNTVVIPNGHTVELSEDFYALVVEAGAPVELLPPVDEVQDDGSAPAAPTGAADGGNGGVQLPPVGKTFDAEAVITGNAPEVIERLTALTVEQLNAVLNAEQNRDTPRKGVIEAVAAKIVTETPQ